MTRSHLPPPTAERVREVFLYDADTGVFLRRVDSRRRPKTLVPAGGGPSAQGYIVIHLDGRTYMAHRLAWLYVHSEWPPEEIDHINGCRTDNRITNLRSVSRTVNTQNQRRPPRNKSSSLPLGVYFVERLKTNRKPYCAAIHVGGRRVHLGYFSSPDDASAAYLSAKRQHHPGCTI